MYWKGLALSRLGKYTEALDCLEKVLSHDPKNADAWVVASNCHFMLGNLEDSGHAFMVAYDIDKRDIRDIVSKGISLMRSGKKREGLECMSGVFGILLR
jgi:tetratricopeptide (TPR) repeat protein